MDTTIVTAMAGVLGSPADLDLVHATDSVDDAIAHVHSHAIEPFGLGPVRRVRSHWRWLGERGLLLPLAALSNVRAPGCTSEHGHRARHSDRSLHTEVTR